MWPRGRSGAAAALWTCLTALMEHSPLRSVVPVVGWVEPLGDVGLLWRGVSG